MWITTSENWQEITDKELPFSIKDGKYEFTDIDNV